MGQIVRAVVEPVVLAVVVLALENAAFDPVVQAVFDPVVLGL